MDWIVTLQIAKVNVVLFITIAINFCYLPLERLDLTEIVYELCAFFQKHSRLKLVIKMAFTFSSFFDSNCAVFEHFIVFFFNRNLVSGLLYRLSSFFLFKSVN